MGAIASPSIIGGSSTMNCAKAAAGAKAKTRIDAHRIKLGIRNSWLSREEWAVAGPAC
jgi:hypothetical protein